MVHHHKNTPNAEGPAAKALGHVLAGEHRLDRRPFGIGKRISIGYTRTLLHGALNGKFARVPFRRDPVFGFAVPTECEGVLAQILNPASLWPQREDYFAKYRDLAARFIETSNY